MVSIRILSLELIFLFRNVTRWRPRPFNNWSPPKDGLSHPQSDIAHSSKSVPVSPTSRICNIANCRLQVFCSTGLEIQLIYNFIIYYFYLLTFFSVILFVSAYYFVPQRGELFFKSVSTFTLLTRPTPRSPAPLLHLTQSRWSVISRRVSDLSQCQEKGSMIFCRPVVMSGEKSVLLLLIVLTGGGLYYLDPRPHSPHISSSPPSQLTCHLEISTTAMQNWVTYF